MICEVRFAESPPAPAGRFLPEQQAAVQFAQPGTCRDDIAATSTVLLANLDRWQQRRLTVLLDTVGHRMESVDSPERLIDRMGQATAACLLIEPGPAALHLARWLSAAGPAVPVLCYAEQPTIAGAVRAMRAGAWTYLEQTVADHDLLAEIQQALDEAARRHRVRTRLRNLQDRFAVLSPREREVFVCTTEGATNRRIAAWLGISHRTVDIHRSNALRKLGVNRFCEIAYDFCLLLTYEEAFPGSGNASTAASSRPAAAAAQTLITCGHGDTI